MARKIFTEFQQETQQPMYEDLVSEYIAKKQELDILEKQVKQLNEQVKLLMLDNGLDNIEKNGYKVTKSESQRITWKEDLLLEKVKTYNNPDLITQVEQVNMPALEQAILDEQINVEDLMECQKTTNVVSLRLSKVKEPKNEL